MPSKKNKVHSSCAFLEKLEVGKAKLYDTIVTVEFNGTSETFSAHKGLICHYSEYFRAAFQGQFTEGTNGISKLPKADHFGFSAFFRWMYEGKVFENEEEAVKSPSGLHDDIFKVYVFADSYLVPALKNAIVDLCIESWVRSMVMPSHNAVTKIWQMCPEGDGMRQLLIDFVTKTNSNTWSESNLKSATFFPDETRDQYPSGFLFEVCKWLVDREQFREPKVPSSYWRLVERCKYHDHTESMRHDLVKELEESDGKAGAKPRRKTAVKRQAGTEASVAAKKRVVQQPDTPSLFGSFF